MTDDRHRLRDAAIEAELETGRRESTEAAARSHVVVRVARMALGTIVSLAGLAMFVLPGPGLLVVAIGLAILAQDVAWADRLLGHVRDRLPADADGRLPRSTVLTMTATGLAGVAFSAWLVLR